MVVDDIQDDAKAKVVGTINEGAEGVWVSIHGAARTDRRRRIPSRSSRELGDRHHFYGCDADPLQTLEMFCRGAPGSGASKGANMQLVENLSRIVMPVQDASRQRYKDGSTICEAANGPSG